MSSRQRTTTSIGFRLTSIISEAILAIIQRIFHSQEVRVLECPKCGMANPPSASSCDCGYVFTSGEVSPELERKRRIDARRRRRGTWSLAHGISSLLLLGVAQFVLHLRGFSVISPSSHAAVVSILWLLLFAGLMLLASLVLACLARGALAYAGAASCVVGLIFWSLTAVLMLQGM